MSTIVTRAGKGAPLTNTELDNNFTNLNTDKLEINAALGTPVSVTLTNATGLPTAGLVDNAVTDAKLRDSAALSVIGRGANSTGDPADIVAGTNHQVLRRDGSSLAFGAVDLSSNQAVTGTLPVNQGGTGITSFGTGVSTWLGTPSSANLAAAVTDETGTGALVFGTSPTLGGTVVDNTTNLVTNANIGTEPNELPLNATLGALAYQSPESVVIKPQAVAVPNGIGDMIFQATSNSVIEMEYKGSDAVVRTAQIPLSNERLAELSRVTPLAQAVRVAMTAAASGSNGIQVLDNANLDMGTNNFTVHWEGSLPDWTPASSIILARKNTDGATAGWLWGVLTAGTMFITLRDGLGGAGTTYTSTVAIGATDGSNQKLSVVITRETASAAGSITYYVNGVQLGSSIAITAGTPFTLDNALTMYLNGSVSTRTACDFGQSIIYNRALSAAEVLSLSVNGPALADLNAKQLELVTDGSFTGGDTGWTKDTGVTIVDQGGGDFEAVFTASGVNAEFWRAPVENITTGRYRVTYTITSYTAGTFRPNIAGVIGTIRSSAGTFTEEVEVTSVGAQRVGIRGLSASNTARVDDISIVRIGITGQWSAENAQSNTGQIFDSSGNKNHALLPAAGATIIGRPTAQPQQVRWTNTWAGTNELQYIGGVNQAILPAKAYIESIVGTVSGATPHDIIVGDGSDTDRYVTITTGLATGTTTFALANRTTDGTNLKLTVDPDTNCVMSIAFTITFRVLE